MIDRRRILVAAALAEPLHERRNCMLCALRADVGVNERPPMRGANQQLLDNVLENLTGVQAKWLAGVRPFFEDLIRLAEDGEVTDEEFVSALERARRQMPELFDQLNTEHLVKALEETMGSAMVNGAVAAAMKRRVA